MPSAMRLFSISSRIASLVTFGASPYFSEVSSTLSLSTSAVTLSLKLAAPSTGPSSSLTLARTPSVMRLALASPWLAPSKPSARSMREDR